ncbi:MAG: hypothetical protein AAB855_02925 [Patescibacteria group bacterium]
MTMAILIEGRRHKVIVSKLGPRVFFDNDQYSLSTDLFHPLSSTRLFVFQKRKYDFKFEISTSPNSRSSYTLPAALNSHPYLLVVGKIGKQMLFDFHPFVTDISTTGFTVDCPPLRYLKADRVKLVLYGYYGVEEGKLEYWRSLFVQSIAHCSRQNYRSSIVESDTAVEVFLSAYIKSRFSALGMPNVPRALRDNRKELLSSVISSPAISKFDCRGAHKKLYDQHIKAHEMRNKIVHGERVSISRESCCRAVINSLRLISVIDPVVFPKQFISMLSDLS